MGRPRSRLSARRNGTSSGSDRGRGREQVVGHREDPGPRDQVGGGRARSAAPRPGGPTDMRHRPSPVPRRASNAAKASRVAIATPGVTSRTAGGAPRRPSSGASRSPRPSTSAGPPTSEERHVRADRGRDPVDLRRRRASAPHASSAPSIAAAASRRAAGRGPPRPGSASRGGPRGTARGPGPPGRDRRRPRRASAAMARRTRLSAVGPGRARSTWRVSSRPGGRARG